MQYAPHGACEPSCGACRSYAKEAMLAITAVERSRLLSLVFLLFVSVVEDIT